MCLDEKTTVNLRVEGRTSTIFEGTVATCGHRVTTRSGGTHHCNGTNNDKNPCAGPTCITALDDANKAASFGFDGTYSATYDDFLITTIGKETPTGTHFWQIALNYLSISVGGCQQKVKAGDEVVFAYATRNVTKHFLHLTGPPEGQPGRAVVFTVTDGDNNPIENAEVQGRRTDASGHVSITFPRPGTFKLKAARPADSIRSNQHVIRIEGFIPEPPQAA